MFQKQAITEQKPPVFLIKPIVEAALKEDLGRSGDITSLCTIPADKQAIATIKTRENGVIAGIDCAIETFKLINPNLRIEQLVSDKDQVSNNDQIMTISGSARDILSAERVALNFLSHMSGIATMTNKMVSEVKEYKTKICCTRKTTPNLRILEKYAVSAGGGFNHRFGLDDAILIKDNHIAVAGSISDAISYAMGSKSHLCPIEVEVDTLRQLEEAIQHPIDAVLLDNMSEENLINAVEIINKNNEQTGRKIISEASGGITSDTLTTVASSGVDIISVGALTHSSKALDLGLDIDL